MISLPSIQLREIRRFAAYGLASVVALGVDMAGYMALLASGMAAPLAAVAGYSLGIVAHWLASSRVVFANRVADAGRPRSVQKGLFIASALVGLALTWVIVSVAVDAGIDARIAKLCAVGTSFIATFLLRLRFVFTLRHAPVLARATGDSAR